MTDRQIAARAYLNRVHHMNQKADALERECETLSKYAGGECAAISELKEIISRERKECYDVISRTKEIIEQADAEHYALLSYRYIGCKRWDEIESYLHISEATRKRMHCEALDVVADVLEKLNLFEPLAPPYHGIRN